MSEGKMRRGRPKGTGIDDSDRIARLAELIKVKPELKPTTAIRVMGISDPSVIRRLRDKYTAYARQAADQTATLARPSSAPVLRTAPTAEAAPATLRH